jgi:hypothetical protein
MKISILFSSLLITSVWMTSAPSQAFSSNRVQIKAKCLKAGGEWGTWTKYEGANNIQSCRMKTKDGGKLCGDGKECTTGLCEYDSVAKAGRCAKFNSTSGCHVWMENGKPGPELCKD